MILNGAKQVYDHLGRKIKVDKECKVPLFIEQEQKDQEDAKADKVLREIDNILKRKMKMTYQDDFFKIDDKKAHAGSPQ